MPGAPAASASPRVGGTTTGIRLVTLETLGSPRRKEAGNVKARDVRTAQAHDLEQTVAYRARFDECGPDGLIRASALLR